MIARPPGLYPASSKEYALVWSATELGDSVTITQSQWGSLLSGAFTTTMPTGLQKDAESQSGLTTTIRVSVDGGSEGDVCNLVNQITTSAGETIHETIPIRISSDAH